MSSIVAKSDETEGFVVVDERQQRHMRRIAFIAIVLSTSAVVASIVTLPMLYSYVQSFQSHLMVETDYCKVRQS